VNVPDALNPRAALADLAALPLEERPHLLLRLAEDLERRIDAAAAPDAGAGTGERIGIAGGRPTMEHVPREP
jgi:hypothetical protein